MILVEHATIVTLDADRRILADGSLLVDGRDIVQVGPAREVRPPRTPDRVIDGRRRLVLPGFVDGRVVLDDGRLTTIDEMALYERVDRLAREQIGRAGLPIESAWPVIT